MAKVDDLNKLLNELMVVYKKYEMLKEMTTDFNIFKSIGSTSDEVNIHSKFICALLNERIYGKKFLFEFLKCVEIELSSHEIIEKVFIDNEHPIAKGRLDLIIEFETTDKEKTIIVIENKIYAVDNEGQIEKYRKELKKRKKQDAKLITKLVYLTLDGSKPTKSTTEDITCISYENDIIQWLNECIKIVALEPKIREVLVQYRAILFELIGKEEDVLMEFKEIISGSVDNFIIANSIEEPLKEVKAELQLRFWQELEKQLEESLKEKGIKNIENTQKDGKLGDSNPWYCSKDNNIQNIRNFYDKTTNWYGLLYDLGEVSDVGKLFLKVEMGYKEIYFGFRKKVEKIDETSGNYRKLIDKLYEKNYKSPERNAWWIGWKWLYADVVKKERINMKIINKNLASKLMDNQEEFNDFIKNCVDQICELVEIVKSVDKSRN